MWVEQEQRMGTTEVTAGIVYAGPRYHRNNEPMKLINKSDI